MVKGSVGYVDVVVFHNNNYHSSSGETPFDLLYSRKCRTPVCWGEVGHIVMRRTEVALQMTELIHQIRQRLQTAQSQQKSYVNKR